MTTPFPSQNKPTVAIVGRPNVGKSTLFNRLTRTRDALVADVPGLTRDLQVGIGQIGPAGYIVIDTGGVDSASEDQLGALVAEQALNTAYNCDAAILLVDGRAGISTNDVYLFDHLRGNGTPTFLAVNKTEGLDPDIAAAEFAELGSTQVHAISAKQGDGVTTLVGAVTASWLKAEDYEINKVTNRICVAVIGRPNVGKSTLVNQFLGEHRMITYDEPGTTRDSIDTEFERNGVPYTVIDTAGLRRKSRVHNIAEKFSAVQALQTLDRAHIALMVIDARDSITDQDMNLLGLIVNSGRALVIVVNKWDGLSTDRRFQIRRDLDRRLKFVNYVRVRCISALHGSGVGDLFPCIKAAWRSAFVEPKTNQLSTLLEAAVAMHQPPLVRGRRIKLRFAHLGGKNPPTIVIHGNQVRAIPNAYKRFLTNYFRTELNLVGTPVRVEFRQGENPFSGRRNQLSRRQTAKRRRLISHAKHRK